MKCNFRFENYPAFEANFGDGFIIERYAAGMYAVYKAAESIENYIQTGSKEYIEGWLYGAVQALCGVMTPIKHGEV